MDFGFILLCTFLEVGLVGTFSCNVSGNVISGSLILSNFIPAMDSRNVNNVVFVSAPHAQRPCMFINGYY